MFAMAVLAIFMLSIVPAALAEEVADGATEQEPLKATKEPGKQAKKVLADTKNGLKLTRERLRLLKTKHLEAKEKFQEQKQNVLRIRDRVKACQEDSEECQKNKKDLKVGVKNHLVKTSDLILRSLEKLVDQIENAKNLTDEEKEEALAKVTSMEEELTAKKAELEALGSEVTAEEIRAGIKELKELWNRIRKEQRWIVTQLINNKMGNVVDKHDQFYNAMEMRISSLEEKGVSEADLADVKRIADKFKEAVDNLKADQEEAEAAWANAKSDPDALELAKEKQKVVREDMKATKDLLREFVKAFNEAKPKKE